MHSIISMLLIPVLFIVYFLWNLPVPFFTATKQFVIEWTMHRLYTTRAEEDKLVFEKKVQELKEKEEEIQKDEIFSLVCESAFESNFQFWFQTQYVLPVLVINILALSDGELYFTDLFNWRFVSIVLSFISISFTAVKIRWMQKANLVFYQFNILELTL